MPTAQRDYTAFDNFLSSLAGGIYAEAPSEPHTSITQEHIGSLYREGLIASGNTVLDVGCRQGVALSMFRTLGLKGTGITPGSDGDVCRAKGLDVRDMDQNFMNFGDGQFNVLWCRHVLERSIAPLWTLHEYHRVLSPGGLAYVEVPAPDTAAHHETDPSHYSVLPVSSWLSLFARSGFIVERSIALNFNIPSGPDTYWYFLLRRDGAAENLARGH